MREKSLLSIAKKYFDLYIFLAHQDIKSRFRRSYLGVGWLVVQQLMFAFVASIVWSRIFSVDTSIFIPFLVIGITIWGFIVSSMVDSCATFVHSKAYLKQFHLPLEVLILRSLCTNVYYLIIGILTSFVVFLCFNKLSIIGIIYFIPGLLILIVYYYSACSTFAYLGLRFRDIQHALTGIFALLFIVTPVIFPPEILAQKGINFIVYLNPFASIIEVVRYPLIYDEFADPAQYAIALGFTIGLYLFQLILKNKWRRLVPFWA
jgi:lipopolysaccharide transport system permease protein